LFGFMICIKIIEYQSFTLALVLYRY
jgi:hypothetical protein